MTRTARTLHTEALDVLLKGRMAEVAVARDWELLREVARLAQQDAPLVLSTTDPALFANWRAAVTKYHLKGWTNMTPERIDAVRVKAERQFATTGKLS
jgi:predicted ATPase